MTRFAPVLLAVLLAACSGVGTSTQPAATASESNGTAMTCEEAFNALSQDQLNDLQSLEQARDTLDSTITACDSPQQWVAQAIRVVPAINDADALLFLEGRCRANPELTHVNACSGVEASPAAS